LLLLAPNPRLRRHGTILPLSPLILKYRPSGFPQSVRVQGNPLRYLSPRSTLRFVYRWQLPFPLRFPRKILEVDYRRIRKKVLRTRLHLPSWRPRRHSLLCIQIVHFSFVIRQWLALVADSVLVLLCMENLCNMIRARVGPGRLFGVNEDCDAPSRDDGTGTEALRNG
jgi:hypothetical protein